MIAHRCGALSVLVALAACATPTTPLTVPRIRSGAELTPYASTTECMALATDERVAYRFGASTPVAFSVQFRQGSAVVIPVEVNGTVGEEGNFAALEGGIYCLVWEAGAQGSVVDYRVQPVRPRR